MTNTETKGRDGSPTCQLIDVVPGEHGNGVEYDCTEPAIARVSGRPACARHIAERYREGDAEAHPMAPLVEVEKLRPALAHILGLIDAATEKVTKAGSDYDWVASVFDELIDEIQMVASYAVGRDWPRTCAKCSVCGSCFDLNTRERCVPRQITHDIANVKCGPCAAELVQR